MIGEIPGDLVQVILNLVLPFEVDALDNGVIDVDVTFDPILS